MERLFEAKTEAEAELVKVIKTSKIKAERQKALKKLLTINGLQKDDLYAIRSKELYVSIPGKPSYYKSFYSASVVYEDTLLKR